MSSNLLSLCFLNFNRIKVHCANRPKTTWNGYILEKDLRALFRFCPEESILLTGHAHKVTTK